MFVDDSDLYGSASHAPEEIKQQAAIQEWQLKKATLFRNMNTIQFRRWMLDLFGDALKVDKTDKELYSRLTRIAQYGAKWQIDCCELAVKAYWAQAQNPIAYIWASVSREAKAKKARYRPF
jgi:hypothetical protein